MLFGNGCLGPDGQPQKLLNFFWLWALVSYILVACKKRSVVIGSFNSDRNPNKRYKFLQSIVQDWWKTWYQQVSLVPNYKWLQRHRNVKPGDVCLIRYKNELKGRYRLGRVKSVKQGADGAVRTVTLLYKNPNEKNFREVDRSVSTWDCSNRANRGAISIHCIWSQSRRKRIRAGVSLGRSEFGPDAMNPLTTNYSSGNVSARITKMWTMSNDLR